MFDSAISWAIACPLQCAGLLCLVAAVAALPIAASIKEHIHHGHPRC